MGKRDATEIGRFKILREEFDISPVFIHTSYLINLASSDKDLMSRSVDMVVKELNIADEIGADYVVLHTGSASGDEPSSARMRARKALASVSEQGNWNAGLLLENTAGEKGDITSRIAEIAEIREQVSPGLISGICLDTCHAFSAGYDITSPEGISALAAEVESFFGKAALKLIHLNDSKKPVGSGVDRHEHIGQGTIGEKGLRGFLLHPLFLNVPLVLETPKKSDDDDSRNVRRVRNMLRQGPEI